MAMLTACQIPSFISTPAAPTPEAPTAIPPTPAPLLSSSPTRQPVASPTPLPASGTAILGLLGQPDSLNPITGHGPALQALTPLLFDSLLRVDPQTAALQPGLAERWEYSANGQQVIFHLPPDLTWSDGKPMTAAAVAAGLTATRHPALDAFAEIETPDDRTLVLTFAGIDCAAVANLALLPLLPAAEITRTVPAGSGPFVPTTWPPETRSLILIPNPTYRGPASELDGIIVRFLWQEEVAIALSEGQFDLVGPLPGPIPEISASQFTDVAYPAPQVIYVAINYSPKNGEALPAEVRQALQVAPDRAAMLAEALSGDGQLLAGSLLPDHWAANDDLRPPPYDPAAARSLLARVGLRDSDGDGWLDQNGKRLELGIRLNGQNELYQKLGWLLSSYYRDLGLFARAEGVPVDSVIDDLFTHDFDLALFSWPLLPEPDQRPFWHSTENTEAVGLNFVSYDNPRVDRLLERAVDVPGCDVGSRARIYADVQETLAEERPADFLLAPNQHLLVGERLQGLEPGPFAPFTWNVTDWYLSEE